MSVDRINILNAPDGTIGTIDKYQFAVGLYPGSDIPIITKSKKFNKIKGKFEFYKEALNPSELKKSQILEIFKFNIK